MKESYYTFLEEVGKASAALFTGAIATYLVQRRKEKADKLAEIVVQSDYWQKQAQDLREYSERQADIQAQEFDQKLKELTEKMQNCYEELRRYQGRN